MVSAGAGMYHDLLSCDYVRWVLINPRTLVAATVGPFSSEGCENHDSYGKNAVDARSLAARPLPQDPTPQLTLRQPQSPR